MMFLCFKAKFRFPECLIPFSFITICFLSKVPVRVRFPILQYGGRFLTPLIMWAFIGWKFTIIQWESALQIMFELGLQMAAKFVLREPRGDIVKYIDIDLRNVWKLELLETGSWGTEFEIH